MKRYHYIILWILLLSVLITTLAIVYLLNKQTQNIHEDVQNTVQEEIERLKIPQVNVGKDGYTPIKNIDYFDGKDGKDGADGKTVTNEQIRNAVSDYMSKNPIAAGRDGYTPTKGVDYSDGENGIDGKTLIIHCNSTKNRWEVKYNPVDTWQLLNGESVKCTTEAQ